MRLYEVTINPENITKAEIKQVSDSEEFYNYSDMVIKYIQKNCQPWLAQSKYFAFRGIKKSEKLATLVKTVRQDRWPRDSSENFQVTVDEVLEKTGFTALRRNSAFVTSKYSHAFDYGEVFMFFPIGEFSYTWNIYEKDMIDFFSSYKNFKYVDFDVSDEQKTDFVEAKTMNVLRSLQNFIRNDPKTEANAHPIKSLNDFMKKSKDVIVNSAKDSSDGERIKKSDELVKYFMKNEEIQNYVLRRQDIDKDDLELIIAQSILGDYHDKWSSEKMIADNLHKSFRKDGLNHALEMRHEVLVKCNKYYLVIDNHNDYFRFRDEIKRLLGLKIVG